MPDLAVNYAGLTGDVTRLLARSLSGGAAPRGAVARGFPVGRALPTPQVSRTIKWYGK